MFHGSICCCYGSIMYDEFAATVGQPLTSPESGWQRYDDSYDAFLYDGTWNTLANSSMFESNQHYSNSVG